MIVDLMKYVIIGPHEELDPFFERAQEEGIFEFISPTAKKQTTQPKHIHDLFEAIKILRKQPVADQVDELPIHELGMQTTERIISLNHIIEQLSEKERMLEAEIARIAVFGDFSKKDLDYIQKEGNRTIQFFCMKSSKTDGHDFTDEFIYIGTAYDLDYFMTINLKMHSYPGMIEVQIEHPLGELKEQRSNVRVKVQTKQQELKKMACFLDLLRKVLLQELNDFHLVSSKKMVSLPLESSLFAVEAWVPKNKIKSLNRLIEENSVYCEPVAIEKHDRIPTCLENKGTNQIGEDLIKIYDIPAKSDKDPSGWVLWAFILFFAMIVADGGYGLLYLTLGLFLKFKFSDIKGIGKRLINLLIMLSVSCVIWGVLTSSFFGIQIDRTSWLSKISVLHYLSAQKSEYHIGLKDDTYNEWIHQYPLLEEAQTGDQFVTTLVPTAGGELRYEALNQFSDAILLEFSLFIGVIHLSLSMIRYLRRNWANLGWLLFMIGGYLYFPSMLNATSLIHFLGWMDKPAATEIGLQMIYAGLGLVFVLSLIQRGFRGITEMANVVTVFADVLSYLRLYALALASSIMARTFNDIGISLGFAVGIFVIVLGHGVNILLGVMGGVIHGLRLNFIEWYHFSYEGGGRLFDPLKKLTRPIKKS